MKSKCSTPTSSAISSTNTRRAPRVWLAKTKPEVISPESLPLSADDLRPRVVAQRQFVPDVQGNCEFLSGDTPSALAEALIARLRQDSTIPGAREQAK